VYGQISKSRLKNDVKSRDWIIKEKNASIEKVKLDNGKLAFEKTRAKGDLKSLLNGYNWLEDSLKKMGVKTKDLQSALFIAQRTEGSGIGVIDTVTILESDTVYTIGRILIQEPFFQLSASFYPDQRYKYTYSIFDSLSVLNTTHRKNIFSNYEHTVRVVNANPKTVISGITSLTIREQPYKWSISLTFGYGISSSGLSPFVGLGVSKPLIKFR
jgi:hypothetical protein